MESHYQSQAKPKKKSINREIDLKSTWGYILGIFSFLKRISWKWLETQHHGESVATKSY
jgi:hypothetical protein